MNRRFKKVTIVDVAAEAGVSFGTVSRVINNDVHVKDETRKKVLDTMTRMNFVANRQARSLAGGKTSTLGLLVPDLGTGYIGEIIRGIDAVLGEASFDLRKAINEIMEICKKELPQYMLPKQLHLCETIPKSINGKKDRKQLRALLS